MSLRNRLLHATVLVGGTLGLLLSVHTPMRASAAGSGLPYQMPSALPPTLYRVPAGTMALYTGWYTLQAIDQRTRLDDGSIYVERTRAGSLIGLVQFYGYDQQGHRTGWFAMLSNFHLLAHGMMRMDLFDQSGGYLNDWLDVTRGTHGDLAGQFTLDGTRYAIRWHRA